MRYALVGVVTLVVAPLFAGSALPAQEISPSALSLTGGGFYKGSSGATPSLPHAPVGAILVPPDDGSNASAAPAAALPTEPIPLTNATSYIMDGVSSVIGPTQETIYNMRIKSDQTALTDYLQLTYAFNLADQKFKPTQILKYVNIGTANPPYFVKNVAAAVKLTFGSTTMNSGTAYSVTTTPSSTFTMSLTAGDAISFLFENQSDDYEFSVVDPYGQKITDDALTRQTGAITQAIPILASGTYKIMVHPLNNSSLSFTMEFLNANRQTMQSRANGSTISNTFTTDLRDYAKYSITLAAGKTLGLTKPSNAQIRFNLMNSRGAIVYSTVGLPMLYQAPAAGTYYLFIDNQSGWGGSYSGKVTIQ